jgi:putative ABC transport system permease protein
LNHLQLALRNLRRRPARSVLTAAGVALAVGSFITLYGLSQSVEQNVQQSIEEHGADLTVRRSGTAELFGGTISNSVGASIAKIPGIVAVSGELISLVGTDRDEHVLATGWAQDSFFWQNVPLEEGRLPQRDERKVALVGIDLARAMQKHAGDNIGLLGEQFQIVGITHFNSIINRNIVVVPLADLQDATFRPGAVTFLSVKLAHWAFLVHSIQLGWPHGKAPPQPSDVLEIFDSERNCALARHLASKMLCSLAGPGEILYTKPNDMDGQLRRGRVQPFGRLGCIA